MTAKPNHRCPGCGKAQDPVPRYPRYFCQGCLKLAEDHAGRRLVFGNASVSGGLSWRYAGVDKYGDQDCIQLICLIQGRQALVTEAKFGGVVAQPTDSLKALSSRSRIRQIDLSRPPKTAEATNNLDQQT